MWIVFRLAFLGAAGALWWRGLAGDASHPAAVQLGWMVAAIAAAMTAMLLLAEAVDLSRLQDDEAFAERYRGQANADMAEGLAKQLRRSPWVARATAWLSLIALGTGVAVAGQVCFASGLLVMWGLAWILGVAKRKEAEKRLRAAGAVVVAG